MRNLKKLLALVLAMVMAFSLMLTASAVDYKDYPDKDSITEEFDEAVRVLTGLKVMQGDEKGFRPADTITRAEAAAIIYRIATGDVDDKQVKIYADYGTFTDVNRDDWFAGYVGYCQNAGYIKGDNATTFRPYGKVTGYEMLAMILRVVGYGKNNEFTGAQWQVNVASRSKDLGITDNVKNANFDTTLSYAARRDVVADLVFQTVAYVPTVTYSPALGYNDKTDLLTGDYYNLPLGAKIFGLDHTTFKTLDDWGRPGYEWYKDNKTDSVVASIYVKPTKTYTETKRECDVAHDLDISTSKDFDLYVNSKNLVTDSYKIVATDTVTKVGGQGRLTEVYTKMDRTAYNARPYFNRGFGSLDDRVVMVDTFLAKVTKVTTVVKDANDHIIVPAQLSLAVYDGPIATRNTPSTHVAEKKTDWEYSVGDYVLINAWTDAYQRAGDTQENAAAFETDEILTDNIRVGGTAASPVYANSKINVLQKSESFEAKQTVTYWNQGKHAVGGQDYMDQLELFLDRAGTDTTTTWAWYKDQYGNIIGIDEAKGTTNYGVITSIYASFNNGQSSTDGTASAVASVTYADGTTGTVTIDRFLVGSKALDTNADHANVNTALVDTSVAPVFTAAASAELIPVYDYSAQDNYGPMTGVSRTATTAKNAVQTATLYVAPVASVNTTAETALETANPRGDNYGIIKGNMFKFVNSADGKMTAVEVAGTTGNTGMYDNNYNGTVTADVKLYKNFSFISATVAAANDTVVRVDSDTKVMLKNPSTGNITTTTPADLTGNITVYALNAAKAHVDSEIDWADPDQDGIAEYVYLTGTVDGTVTYGLFYTRDESPAQWNGTEKNGTISGWLNGEATTLTFTDQDEFNTILRNRGSYGARLYAVQLTNGVVSNLMGTDKSTSIHYEQIADEGAPIALATLVTLRDKGTAISSTNGVTAVTASGTAANRFQTGTANGNNYDDITTTIVHVKDTNVASTGSVTYNDQLGTITASGYGVYGGGTYLITGSTKIVGDSLYFLNNDRRVSDVTIVYDSTTNVASEIYVTTEPDYTPGEGNNVAAVDFGQINADNYKFQIDVSSSLNLTYASPAALVNNFDKVHVKIVDRDTNGLVADRDLPVGDISGGLLDVKTGGAAPYTGTIELGRNSTNGNKGNFDITVEWYRGSTLIAKGEWINVTVN